MATINPNGSRREIKIKGLRLETVENFKYPRTIISNEGSNLRLFKELSGQQQLCLYWGSCWRDKTATLSIHTRAGPLQQNYRKKNMKNEAVCRRIHDAVGVHDDLLTMIKNSGTTKTVLQETVKVTRRGRKQKNRREHNRTDRHWA